MDYELLRKAEKKNASKSFNREPRGCYLFQVYRQHEVNRRFNLSGGGKHIYFKGALRPAIAYNMRFDFLRYIPFKSLVYDRNSWRALYRSARVYEKGLLAGAN